MWVTIITYAVVTCVMTYGFLKLEAKLIALSYEIRLLGIAMKYGVWEYRSGTNQRARRRGHRRLDAPLH